MSAMEIVNYYQRKLSNGEKLSEREQREYDAYRYATKQA